ncbi:MAG: hypothetical protein HQK87_11905 [Nitrospinae bacterium]|nr:hypothetical protein [Nitrospinota bacterium]
MENEEGQKLEIKIFNEAVRGEARIFSVGAVETILDTVFEVGTDFIDKFPITSSVTALVRGGFTIKDRLFIRKLYYFFDNIEEVTDEEKQEFLRQYASDEKKQRKLGENIIVLLESCNDMEKPRIHAKLFTEFMRGRINQEIYLRFSHIIDRSFVHDIQQLEKINRGEKIDIDSQTSLFGLGLMGISSISGGTFSSSGIEHNIEGNDLNDGICYSVNNLGKRLSEVLF